MQARGETNPDACEYNDFALVRIDPADVGKVNPSVPGFGGPTGVGEAADGSTVYSYGNSSLRGGVTKLSPKQGPWSRPRATAGATRSTPSTPGIPGDSGSGFLNSSGQAFGVLSTLQVLPAAGSNGVGDLSKELAYMRANSSSRASSSRRAPSRSRRTSPPPSSVADLDRQGGARRARRPRHAHHDGLESMATGG